MEAASMEIRTYKTTVMHIHPKLKVTATTIEDINYMTFAPKWSD